MANISKIKVGDTSYGITATPTAHASTATTYGAASASNYGHVKLSDNYTSSAGAAASGIGASSAAVYNAYNTLNSNLNKKYLYHKELPLSTFGTSGTTINYLFLSKNAAGTYPHFTLTPEELIPNENYNFYIRNCIIYLRNNEYANGGQRCSAYSNTIGIIKYHNNDGSYNIYFCYDFASEFNKIVTRSLGGSPTIHISSITYTYAGSDYAPVCKVTFDTDISNIDIDKYVIGLIVY